VSGFWSNPSYAEEVKFKEMSFHFGPRVFKNGGSKLAGSPDQFT
jgi:hypothetical protein